MIRSGRGGAVESSGKGGVLRVGGGGHSELAPELGPLECSDGQLGWGEAVGSSY